MALDKPQRKRVGAIYPPSKKKFLYEEVNYDKSGFADADQFLPKDFDLCYCKVENKTNLFPCWYTGTYWDGINISRKNKVTKWKINRDI